MDVEDVISDSSEYSVRVMGLLSCSLHCSASNLMLEILKRDKIWGQFTLASPTPNSGELVAPSPVI